MFASLSERFSKVLRDLRGLSTISESNLEPVLVEVRQALMAADVHFRVARDFTDRVKVACLGQAVTESVTPAQMAVKIPGDPPRMSTQTPESSAIEGMPVCS